MTRTFLFAAFVLGGLGGCGSTPPQTGARTAPEANAPPAELSGPATGELAGPPVVSPEIAGEAPRGEAADEDSTSAPPIATVPPNAGLDPIASELLALHNQVRAKHCAPALVWSAELAEVASTWARALAHKGCAFVHSSTRYGENLAAGTASALDPTRVVAMWADEVDAYDFGRPGFSGKTGHFTQVVWKSTTAIGCGVAQCRNGNAIWVCNYDPAGNVDGGFPKNVLPARC